MLSQQHTRKRSLSDHTAAVLDDTAHQLFKEQKGILNTYYNKKTGNLARHLASNPFKVVKSQEGVKLVINYIAQIRFMDLKKLGSGKKKKIYHPIYNKPVYGFLFGYAYSRLRSGLTSHLQEETVANIDPIKIEIPV